MSKKFHAFIRQFTNNFVIKIIFHDNNRQHCEIEKAYFFIFIKIVCFLRRVGGGGAQ